MSSELYKQKLEYFCQLRRVTGEIAQFTPGQLVDEDEAHERLLRLLEEREQLMSLVDALDAELAQRGGAGPEDYVRSALLDEMSQIRELNSRVEEVLQGSLVQLREEARKIKEGKHSQRAYLGGASAEGAFIDKRR